MNVGKYTLHSVAYNIVVHLGAYKSADGDCTNEIKKRIAMARQKAVELTTIWKNKNVSVCIEYQSEVDGLGSVSVWCEGMDIKEIG